MNKIDLIIDALKNCSAFQPKKYYEIDKALAAARELKAELAKPEQASTEPPDYVEPPTSDYHNGWEEGFEAAKNLFKKRSAPQSADPRLLLGRSDDCNAPQQLAKPEQEPVAWLHPDKKVDVVVPTSLAWFDKPVPLYTAPQRKEWVGLTDDDAREVFVSTHDLTVAIRLIEAKLKEKNT